MLEQISDAVGESVPMACQDWANTKAAYRFFSNERVNEADILAGHFQATKDRFMATQAPILVLHDTTEFSFRRESPDQIGIITIAHGRRGEDRRPHPRTVCGILMHSSLAVTTEGLPLGLAAIKFWNREAIQRNSRAEEEDQSNAHSDRAEGEHTLAAKPEAVHRNAGRPSAVRSHRRPRERHL